MEKERIQYNCQSLIVFPLPFIRPIIYFSPFLLILPLFFSVAGVIIISFVMFYLDRRITCLRQS